MTSIDDMLSSVQEGNKKENNNDATFLVLVSRSADSDSSDPPGKNRISHSDIRGRFEAVSAVTEQHHWIACFTSAGSVGYFLGN